MLNWLNPNRNNREAFLDAERTRAENSRITQAAKTSRMTVTRDPSIVLTVTKTAHGFTPGQAVYYTVVAGSPYWYLASALTVLGDIIGGSGLAENYIGVVVDVPSVNTFRVAMSGLMSIDDPTFLTALNATQCYYCLGGTAGTLVQGIGSSSGYYPGRAVVFSHGNNLYEFISPSLQSSHDHNITKFVSQTSHGFSVGDWVNTTYAKATVANSSGLPVGMVVEVVDANNFKACFQGVVNWPGGLGALVMFLTTGTAGTISGTTSPRPVAWSANFGSYRVYIDGLSGTASGALRLEDLTDVSITSPATHDVVYWSGSAWVNGPSGGWLRPTDLYTVTGGVPTTDGKFLVTYLIGSAVYWHTVDYSINTLGDVNVSGAALGDVLSFNGTGWVNAPAVTALAALTDVALSSPADGQGLIYDSGTSKWVNGDLVTALSSLTDVVITSAANGDLLMWNGSDWVNVAKGSDNQFFAMPVTGSGSPAWRGIDPRDMPRRMVFSPDTVGSGTPVAVFGSTAVARFMTTSDSYSDLIADPPTAAHFDVKWNSGIAFGSDTGGALEIVHTDNSGTYSLAINRNAELQIVFGTLPGANSITLQLAAIIDLLGSSVSPSIAGAINMVPREIPICVGGVAKKVIVLASQDY